MKARVDQPEALNDLTFEMISTWWKDENSEQRTKIFSLTLGALSIPVSIRRHGIGI